MPLTDKAVKNAKAGDKPVKLFDGGGMFLLVTPAGQRYWRLKYRVNGKEKLLALGVYPDVSLAVARKKRDEAREKLAAGIDPNEAKREVKRTARIAAASSFEAVAREWFDNQRVGWTETYAEKVIHSLEIDAFPKIGSRPISSIEAPEMLEIIRAIEARGVRETAKRLLQRSRAVFQYAIMTGRCTRNPSADIDAETILKKGPGVQHMARVKPLEIPQLMRDIAAYPGEPVTRLALELMALTFVRTKEMIRAQWAEFDEAAAEWRVPPERMKMRDPHIVPLSRQSLVVLEQLRQINGDRPHVFYSVHGRAPISNNTMLFALYRMGYKSRMTGHGFRGLAATMLRELGYSRDVVDRQLAHAERNQVTAAYAHAEYLPERRRMMQHWADHLDKLKAGL
ncbi:MULTISPECIES: tyrosine-type recombinase/integrase [Burkholderia]|uniref:tyrosine-type recombinase/integrase n=1 Tax=Burkholderia TaxID=32008 RepID=UPI00016B0ABA|nr:MULTISPECIES: integrase arm-type DNA-binding domain-containing protein [Burkholderia]AGZ29651.1 phage integrase family protein [Burkholderia pseudomallei NCTC 13179]AIO94389.1 phage integrase family protein [Burkholderia pseudomallei 576]AIV90583.1 phage integrase family protein [Burkholderia pseudomallei B03]AIV96301.1 phage integrase family protein [Burkholderia pseudomallei A79A]AJX95408.1 phage integrase family protein [Burkholderia pseudomallei PB08298010]